MIIDMDARPIKTEADYDRALAEIAPLFDAEPDSPEEDRLVILGMLIEDYEAKHYPIASPDPIAALEYYMESRGLERQALEPIFGDPAEVAGVLSRERPLTLDMIRRRLHDGLGISADVLIQPYPLLQAA
jgi:HTH-type transcriptional regulator/antitoxin HigA